MPLPTTFTATSAWSCCDCRLVLEVRRIATGWWRRFIVATLTKRSARSAPWICDHGGLLQWLLFMISNALECLAHSFANMGAWRLSNIGTPGSKVWETFLLWLDDLFLSHATKLSGVREVTYDQRLRLLQVLRGCGDKVHRRLLCARLLSLVF